MLNKVMLIGNLGSDPEVRTTTTEKKVASFSLATSERYKDRHTGEAKSITDWHNVVAWGNLAEIAGKYLRKGNKVYIEGKIRTRSYDANGAKRYVTEIIADTLVMLGEKPQAAAQVVESSGHRDGNTDDLPF